MQPNSPQGVVPPMGRLSDVDGRRLALYRSGSGSPSVVFLPGAGLIGLEYLRVCELVAEFATSVVYDRAGTGWSDPVALPRSAAEVAGELHDLLRVADIPSPYVLVGHSLGAFYARRFAQLFGSDVAGLVLVDPGHEDILSYLPKEAEELNVRMKAAAQTMPDLTEEQLTAARAGLAKLYASWPDAVRAPLIEQRLASWRTGLAEAANLESEVYDELRDGGPLPDVPLIVLTAMEQNPLWAQFGSEELVRQAHEGVHAMHAAMAASLPRGQHRALDGASHQYLQVQQPEAVARAIRDLLP